MALSFLCNCQSTIQTAVYHQWILEKRAFILMTRRRAIDYKATFRAINEQLNLPSVCRVITDFERATFSAVREVYPNVHHFGCNFHFQQGIMKQVKGLGLASQYCKKGVNPIRDFIHKLMCLAYLPPNKIPEVFEH